MTEHPMSIEIRRLESEIERLKVLLTRAADALEDYAKHAIGWTYSQYDNWHMHDDLIKELRKAAE